MINRADVKQCNITLPNKVVFAIETQHNLAQYQSLILVHNNYKYQSQRKLSLNTNHLINLLLVRCGSNKHHINAMNFYIARANVAIHLHYHNCRYSVQCI